jgi:hypothetical protein
MELTDLQPKTRNNNNNGDDNDDDDHSRCNSNDVDVDLEGNTMDPLEMTTIEENDNYEEGEGEEILSLLWRNGGKKGVMTTKGLVQTRLLNKTTTTATSPRGNSIWQRHWLGIATNDNNEESWIWYRGGPDNDEEGILLLDATLIKFFKFVIVAIACVFLVHSYVWLLNDKRDVTYAINILNLLQYLRTTIYCIVNNILQYIVNTIIYFCATLPNQGCAQ